MNETKVQANARVDMTVTYTLEVSQARFWGFPKLLARWRGSIYRLMYREMFVFLLAYYLVAFLYRYAATLAMQRRFERFAIYCKEFTAVVPITFLMGFYVAFVVGRWWQQYMAIPWPDRLAMEISAYVQGADERGRLIRRAMARYLNLLAVLTFQSTSTVIKKRFPSIEHLVEAGLLTEDERVHLEKTATPHGIWWIPAQWFAQLAIAARKEGRIFDDMHLKSLIDDLMTYRGQCGLIWSYDWISVPLVYTQVVTIAVYSFFASCLFGRQYLLHGTKLDERLEVDYYLPIFTIFQFFFYVGWLKVAESMICPFGEDDDDFDMNWLVDRNVQVSYVIVDQMHRKSPKLTRDMFWDNFDTEMPYTQAAANYKREPFFGSTTAMNISVRGAEWDVPSDQMPAISEERLESENTPRKRQNSSSEHGRRKWQRDANKSSREELNEDDEDVSVDADDDDDDVESITSGQFEAKEREKRGLIGLALGYSRQALGSKQSLASHLSKSTVNTNKWNRSPGTNRKNSIPVCSSRRLTDSSPRSGSPMNGVVIPIEHPAFPMVREDSVFRHDSSAFSSTLSSIAVDIPPAVEEESENDASNGSLHHKSIALNMDDGMGEELKTVGNMAKVSSVSQSTVHTADSGFDKAIKSISNCSNASEDSGQRSSEYDSETLLIKADPDTPQGNRKPING